MILGPLKLQFRPSNLRFLSREHPFDSISNTACSLRQSMNHRLNGHRRRQLAWFICVYDVVCWPPRVAPHPATVRAPIGQPSPTLR